MDRARQLVADTLALQGVSKAAASAFAGVQPSALSHWLNGKPSISPEKLAQLLAFIGLKLSGDEICFRDNVELLSPRIWRTENHVTEASIRCMARVREQYGSAMFGLPSDIRGAAILFSMDGRWGAVQRCNPVLLVGHRDSAAKVGPGVIQRILDGDTKALIDAANILALAGRVDLEALDVASSLRETADIAHIAERSSQNETLAEQLVAWGEVSAEAVRHGLTPSQAKLLIRRFFELKSVERDQFLQGIYRYSAGSMPHSEGSS